MNVQAREARFLIRWLAVQDEQAVELVCGKARCDDGLEVVNDGEQLCLAGLLT